LARLAKLMGENREFGAWVGACSPKPPVLGAGSSPAMPLTYRWTDRSAALDVRVDRKAAEDYKTAYTSASILPFALYPYGLFKGHA
jgi:hypothetical protein